LRQDSFPAVAHDPNDAPQQPVTEDPALDSLEARLAAARKAEDERLAKDHVPYANAHNTGFQIASTMVGYPLGGFVIGMLLDRVFDTLPWITIGLMMLSFAGACVHVVRNSKNVRE
jgi:F0F1-type ATP synthase assembly protein I